MNNNSGSNSSANTSNSKIQNFLEALRASRTQTFETGNHDLATNPFTELRQKKEIEKRRAELFFKARQQEWNQIFSSKEKAVEKQIEQIREQLKLLSKQARHLDKNLQKAVDSPVPTVGAYQENFLTHIYKMIQVFNLKVQEANSWLEIYNSRSAKKGFYWSMAKTKGSSFTQSNERVVATSIG